jgi:hypothetical protein
MIHLQWETTAPPEGDAAGDAVSPAGDLLVSPNFGICDTTLPLYTSTFLLVRVSQETIEVCSSTRCSC